MNPKAAPWDENPIGAFEGFLSSPEFIKSGRERIRGPEREIVSDESAKVYKSMFAKFARWIAEKRIPFTRISQVEVQEFLNAADLHSAIATRYIRLLERCYTHLKIVPNPAARASHAIRESGAQKFDRPTVVLSDDEFSQFMRALPVYEVKYPRGGLQNGWKRRRDRAMQMVMACAGLRVAEVVGLRTIEVSPIKDIEGTLRIDIEPEGKHHTSFHHTTLLRAEASDQVLEWIAERVRLPIPGDLVFPANEHGGPINKSTVYRQVAATFKRAGIDPTRSGGRTLRNTFAVQDLNDGLDLRTVAAKLGLSDEDSVATYVKAKILK